MSERNETFECFAEKPKVYESEEEHFNDIFAGYEADHQKALALIAWQEEQIKNLETAIKVYRSCLEHNKCYVPDPIVAPCDVGALVYLLDKDELENDPQNAPIYEDTVYEVGRGVTADGSVKWLCLVEESGLDFYDTDIGVTVFFEYEAALRVKKQIEEG